MKLMDSINKVSFCFKKIMTFFWPNSQGIEKNVLDCINGLYHEKIYFFDKKVSLLSFH